MRGHGDSSRRPCPQDPNYGKLSSMHFYGWKRGLKTGMYYLRTKSAADAIKFTVDQKAVAKAQEKTREQALSQVACSLANREECLSCGA